MPGVAAHELAQFLPAARITVAQLDKPAARPIMVGRKQSKTNQEEQNALQYRQEQSKDAEYDEAPAAYLYKKFFLHSNALFALMLWQCGLLQFCSRPRSRNWER